MLRLNVSGEVRFLGWGSDDLLFPFDEAFIGWKGQLSIEQRTVSGGSIGYKEGIVNLRGIVILKKTIIIVTLLCNTLQPPRHRRSHHPPMTNSFNAMSAQTFKT